MGTINAGFLRNSINRRGYCKFNECQQRDFNRIKTTRVIRRVFAVNFRVRCRRRIRNRSDENVHLRHRKKAKRDEERLENNVEYHIPTY